MNRSAFSLVASLCLHIALLASLSYAAMMLPVQTSFQRGRAAIELQASIAAAPPDESDVGPTIKPLPKPVTEETPTPDLQPTETEIAREPAADVAASKPEVEPAARDEPIPETSVAAKAVTESVDVEPVVDVKPEPPARSQADARPRDVVAPTESVATTASQAETGVDYDEPAEAHPRNRHPPYPADAYARRQEGTVVLHLQVTSSGAVGEVRISQSSGVASLDRAAVAAAREWRYTPARRRGVNVAMTFETRVNFYFNRG